jgi:hypothetical protein
MTMMPLFGCWNLPVFRSVGLSSTAWAHRARRFQVAAPVMTNIPTGKPRYVSASERCP